MKVKQVTSRRPASSKKTAKFESAGSSTKRRTKSNEPVSSLLAIAAALNHRPSSTADAYLTGLSDETQ